MAMPVAVSAIGDDRSLMLGVCGRVRGLHGFDDPGVVLVGDGALSYREMARAGINRVWIICRGAAVPDPVKMTGRFVARGFADGFPPELSSRF